MHAPITLTDAAIKRITQLMQTEEAKQQSAVGIRVSVNSKGCSGLAYDIAFTDTANPLDDKIQAGEHTLFIDPAASMFIIGSEMDYVESDLKSGFEFNNPNEAGRCGCGESFFVERPEEKASTGDEPQ